MFKKVKVGTALILISKEDLAWILSQTRQVPNEKGPSVTIKPDFNKIHLVMVEDS